MLYRLYPRADQTCLYFERFTGIRLPSCTERELRARYPHGGYAIVGEIGNLARHLATHDKLLASDGTAVPLFPRGSLRPWERIVGYVAVGEHAYAAAVGSLWPLWPLRRQRP